MQENLYSYRENPYQLLKELEYRCRTVNQSYAGGGQAKEWVGIAFRIGDEVLMTSRSDVREVLALIPSTRVPGAKAWIKGLANLRSQLIPVIDFAKFLGAEQHQTTGQERMLVVNHDRIPAALVVDEVLGFRRFSESELSKNCGVESIFNLDAFLLGECSRDDNAWPVIGLRKLVESQQFMQSSAIN